MPAFPGIGILLVISECNIPHLPHILRIFIRAYIRSADGFGLVAVVSIRILCESRWRAERSREVAEFLVLPVEEALEDFHGQRFAGGEDGAEGGADVVAVLFQVGELALEPLAEDAAKPLRE